MTARRALGRRRRGRCPGGRGPIRPRPVGTCPATAPAPVTRRPGYPPPARRDPRAGGTETGRGDGPPAADRPPGHLPPPAAPARSRRRPQPADAPRAAGPAHVDPAAPRNAPADGAARPVSPAQGGLAALSLPGQLAAALALAVVAVAVCAHLGMVFLHVAPSNTVTKQHGRVIDEWIYPEFEQNWKLFAPDPLQQNVAVQVRALVRAADGVSSETGWYDLSALDGRAIDANPLPSHTEQNELRRAWDLYVNTHDAENRPAGLRGDLSEHYLRRIAAQRLARAHAGGAGAVVERVQLRSRTTNVPPPRWSDEKASVRPVVRELPWWPVPAADRVGGPTEAGAR